MPVHNQFIQRSDGAPDPAGLTALGAYFIIEVHVPPRIAQALIASGKPVPNCVSGLAVVDTGATFTCVDEGVLRQLGLNPVGVVNSGTAGGVVRQNVYPARIMFPTEGWTVDLGQAVGVNLAGQEIPLDPPKPLIALLGRNLLEGWVLVYNGPAGHWSVSH